MKKILALCLALTMALAVEEETSRIASAKEVTNKLSFFFSAGRRLRQRLCFHRRLCHRQAAFGQGRVLVHVQRGRARGNGHPKGR